MITLSYFSQLMQMQGKSIAGVCVYEVTAERLSSVDIQNTYAGFFSFFRVERGKAMYIINSRSYQLGEGDVMALSPRQLVYIETFSENYCALYVSAEESAVEEFLTHKVECKILADWFISSRLPTIQKDGFHSTLIGKTMHLMKQLQLSTGVGVCETVQTGLLNNVMCFVSDALFDHEEAAGICHQEVIYRQFIALVAECYTKEHSTRFYATQLCVTPVYLARIVRRYAKKTVKEFILSQVYRDAYHMLRYTDTPVGDIAKKLGFPDIETFSKFFKRRNGNSPSKMKKMTNM
jgi:AraC-like DNA-binding protein